jgi:cytochrome c biogenesis protein
MGAVGWLRWAWRQLTSMKVALILLFLLALASIPGSLVPQRGINEAKVIAYFEEQPQVAEWLDRFGLFDVFTAPWFAAVYLLLFVSLIGCVVPRAWHHARALRTPPPPAPRNLDRLPSARDFREERAPAEVLDAAAAHLEARKFRVRRGADGSVAAEKGYARETGNLVFHLSLIVLLVGVAVGSLYGYRGNVVVREGAGFSNTLTQYDSFRPGRAFDATALAPFSFRLDEFRVEFETEGSQRGSPREFEAIVTSRESPGADEVTQRVAVNSPLKIAGSKAFLMGWGYAPRFTVTDGEGNVVLSDTVPFLPQDGFFTSTGVIKSPDARPEQLGLQGVFLPTTSIDESGSAVSVFPAAVAPSVFLSAWTGDLGLDDGRPQSVYTLDVDDMEQIGSRAMLPGDTWELPGGVGTVEFEGVEQFATFSVARDPGSGVALGASIAALAGLLMSLFIRRRRLWVRAATGDDGRTVVHVAGLARTENGDPGVDLDELVEAIGLEQDPSALPVEASVGASVGASADASVGADGSGEDLDGEPVGARGQEDR